MSRPTRIDLNPSESGWVSRFNSNSENLIDKPVPLVRYSSISALASAKDARLNIGCLALVGSDLYRSNGTAWEKYREVLNYIPDLTPGVSTVSDIKSAYNGLLADMVSKGWMPPS